MAKISPKMNSPKINVNDIVSLASAGYLRRRARSLADCYGWNPAGSRGRDTTGPRFVSAPPIGTAQARAANQQINNQQPNHAAT